MFERRLHALIAGVILLVVALILGVIIAVDPASSLVQGIDDRWLRWMVSSRTPFWTRVAKDVSAIGSVHSDAAAAAARIGGARRGIAVGCSSARSSVP